MNCTNCGAPLATRSNRCRFCDTLNDSDLRRFGGNVVKGAQSPVSCPRCNLEMRTIEIDIGESFEIEQCESCFGLFFDPHELEAVLDESVSPVHEVDHRRLQILLDEEGAPERISEVAYLPCPSCRQPMHRKTYGARAGVIVDRCREHGVWLDGGELSQLLEWASAGGRLHDSIRKQEAAKNAEARKKAPSPLPAAAFQPHSRGEPVECSPLTELFGALLGLLR